MTDYTYRDRARIEFTEEDIALALDGLSKDDRLKTVATLSVSTVSPEAIRHFSALAVALRGQVKSDYGYSIVVPKDDDELRSAALYALRYNSSHEVLRDLRAAEQGIEPKTED